MRETPYREANLFVHLSFRITVLKNKQNTKKVEKERKEKRSVEAKLKQTRKNQHGN
jgi:hypothetical protein